ncbi:MAG TPA: hypothetical protein DEA08_32530 [Planctomycetes bacterium]|nr:hypothetical protein [Planctomycetota bacterium]
MVSLTLSLLLPLLCSDLITLTLPPRAGEVAAHAAKVKAEPWRGRLELPEGLAWITLDGIGATSDLDLRAELGERAQLGQSHQARERLLVQGPGPLSLTVAVAAGSGGDFSLGVTRLEAEEPLLPGERRLALEAERSVRLLPLPEREAPLALLCKRLAGEGDVDLFAYSASGVPLAFAEVRPEREVVLLPPEARSLIVRAKGGAASVVLHAVEAKGEGPLDRFLGRLARTPGQRKAIAALRTHPDFLRIEAYLRSYPGGLPLQLRVVPGLVAHGVERYGTYSQGTLTINPTIAEHRNNPQELVDTLLHELIHALLALPRAEGFPLGPEVLDSSHDPHLRGAVGSPLRRSRIPLAVVRYLEQHYGPSASNPSEDFTDINGGAQRMIVKVIRDLLARSQVGRETLVFRNLERRSGAVK